MGSRAAIARLGVPGVLVMLCGACNEKGQSPTDGAATLGDGDKIPDDGDKIPGDGACARDNFEPNDTPLDAFVLPAGMPEVQLADLALCPDTDVDHFSIVVPATQALEAVVTLTTVIMPELSILSPAGTPIAFGEAGDATVRALATNLPEGTYVVRVGGRVEVGYSLTVRVNP
jgi:hypothetical protein